MTSDDAKAPIHTQFELQSATINKAQNHPSRTHIVWANVCAFASLHIAAIYGVWLAMTSAKLATVFFAYFLNIYAGFGVTGGAHRLWSHRSFKAKVPLQILLMLAHCMAMQNSVIEWARDHRVHHKYTETDADPHNAKRGFFFAHIGWLLSKKHPDVKRKGKGVQMSDLEHDPILQFQRKYYIGLVLVMWLAVPMMIPVYLWNESWTNAFFVATILRYVFTLNVTWLVNSAAHLFGGKPYDKQINPSENKMVSLLTGGEGWHNYHHVFPMDYRASELGNLKYNWTTFLIVFFSKIGWAYDLVTISPEDIRDRVIRTGDGTHDVWRSVESFRRK